METELFLQMALDRANHVDLVQQIALSEQDELSLRNPYLPKNAIDGYRFALPILRADLGQGGNRNIFAKGAGQADHQTARRANQSGVFAVARRAKLIRPTPHTEHLSNRCTAGDKLCNHDNMLNEELTIGLRTMALCFLDRHAR
jgi:hypothetical protein